MRRPGADLVRGGLALLSCLTLIPRSLRCFKVWTKAPPGRRTPRRSRKRRAMPVLFVTLVGDFSSFEVRVAGGFYINSFVDVLVAF